MKKIIFAIWVCTLEVLYLVFPRPSLGIVPDKIKPLPNFPFVMLDCENKDWGQLHPEWGPVGGWRDFGSDVPGCTGGTTPEDYIRAAKKINKPVGIGLKFTSSNIQTWAARLNNPEFDNLAFVMAVSPSIYGEVLETDLGWALNIMEPLSKAFPNIPVFYQGTVNTLGSLGGKAVTLTNKNISLKCNGWDLDLDNAQETVDGLLSGGVMRFAEVWGNRLAVGYEPRHGLTSEEHYWALLDALSHHPDIFDISASDLSRMATFKTNYGFPLLEFTRNHLGKTLENTPDVWVVLRTTQVGKVCYCNGGADACQSPECCWTSGGQQVCRGPQRGNFSSWLYQKDGIPGGRTVAFSLSDKSHPYSRYTVRRTDQASGNRFMAFDIDDGYPRQTTWDLTVTFVNQGNDKLSLIYKNYAGETIKKTIQKGGLLGTTNQWLDYTFNLEDAYFNNNLDGVDFKIDSENDGDEIVHRVILQGSQCQSQQAANLDCDPEERVNQADLEILLANWSPQSPPSFGKADLNQDGLIDEGDLSILLSLWKN